jgi:polyphosphate glucokinase
LKILVLDIGGNNVKLLVTGQKTPRKVPSGPTFTPGRMVAAVKKAVAGWKYDAVTIGYPGPVKDGRILAEPVNLGRGWVRYDFRKAFRRPVRIINDAAMQALGSYDGASELFLGLGTGLGAALVVEGVLQPLEIAHLPYRNGKTYEDFLGKRAQDRMGKKRWRKLVWEIVPRLREAFQVDEVVLGGGNVKQLKAVPPGCRHGDNANAFLGGFRLWHEGRRPAKKNPAARRR